MIYHADCRSIPLPDGCVQCAITSPPYYGLRDYGVEGQIGLEATPEAYLDTMVAVFRELKRVLRDDGTVWLNIGDSYASQGGKEPAQTKWQVNGASDGQNGGLSRTAPAGYKPKDLMLMPARLALALQADGWWVRSDVIWNKPNPMPESVQGSHWRRCLDENDDPCVGCEKCAANDGLILCLSAGRPTRSHEDIFLLTKRSSYYYDADAIREPQTGNAHARGYGDTPKGQLAERTNRSNSSFHVATSRSVIVDGGRNRRDVWTIPSQATPEAHFATFPEKLVEPCVLAGTSAKGCCSECGAPYVREVERTGVDNAINEVVPDYDVPGLAKRSSADRVRRLSGATYQRVVAGTNRWRATCTHDAPIQPCLVFDPFLGSGTVGVVCERLGRRWAGTELSEAYIKIAEKRTCQQGLFSHAIAD